MWIISYRSLSARVSDAKVWLFADYPETPYESSPPTFRRRDLEDILDDFENHLVSEEYCRVLAHVH